MDTPKIRVVLLNDSLADMQQEANDEAHLAELNAILDALHSNVVDSLNSDFSEDTEVVEEPQPDNVSIVIPDGVTFGGSEYFVHPDVAEYINQIESEAKQRNTLDAAVNRVLSSGYRVNISNM